MNLDEIRTLSLEEKKSLLERTVKLQEETGELAQAVLIAAKLSGSQYKTSSKEAVKEESVDVILVALSIFFFEGGTPQELETLLKTKSAKWKQHQMQ